MWGRRDRSTGVAGDGEPFGSLPEAAALIVGVDDLEAKAHFALPVGELVSFAERKGQQGGSLLSRWLPSPASRVGHHLLDC